MGSASLRMGETPYMSRLRVTLELGKQRARAAVMERSRAIRARKDSLPADRPRGGS